MALDFCRKGSVCDGIRSDRQGEVTILKAAHIMLMTVIVGSDDKLYEKTYFGEIPTLISQG